MARQHPNYANLQYQRAYHSCQQYRNSVSVPAVQKIADGSVILNDIKQTTIFDHQVLKVNGTFLLTFMDMIKINETTYQVEKNVAFIEAHPPKTLECKRLGHENKVSLVHLQKLHIDITNRIGTLKEEIFMQKHYL